MIKGYGIHECLQFPTLSNSTADNVKIRKNSKTNDWTLEIWTDENRTVTTVPVNYCPFCSEPLE